jgi:hypothetical protein
MSWSRIRIGDRAPDLELVTLDGEAVPLHRAWDQGAGLLVFLRHLG